jgi:hypothetical protein
MRNQAASPLNFRLPRDVNPVGQEAHVLSMDGLQRATSSVEGRMQLYPEGRDRG